MARTNRSARQAGARFERSIADHLNTHVDDRIDRRVKTGSRDKGDIAGLRHMGGRVVIECKDTARTALGTWMAEADVQRGNDDALAGLVVHKRHGVANPGSQWVTTTLDELIALLTGNRDHLDHPTDTDGRTQAAGKDA